jgi:glyoxylase-like metal-dependent hydrolase (beta-lactamase superfamily II)
MKLQDWICVTCGVQYSRSENPPERCPICEDERQYVGLRGQTWTSLEELQAGHKNLFAEEERDVWSIRTEPAVGIGQRAYLIQTSEGNLLWDCLTLIDGETIERIQQLGGLAAIAISHPHYYSSVVEWSNAFGEVPVWIHADDRQWVVNAPPRILYWEGEAVDVFGEIKLVRSGGHFEGYQVAFWPRGAAGAGALFAGDQPQVALNGKLLTFMYSYPNWIPFDAETVRRITSSLEPLAFDRLYGAFGRNILSGAKQLLANSQRRYLRAIGAEDR